MGDKTRASCRNCGRHRKEVGPISWEGYCGECGPMIRDQANDDLHYHRGPVFMKWRRAMAATVGGILLDDLQATE
jgi:hypothetical protein